MNRQRYITVCILFGVCSGSEASNAVDLLTDLLFNTTADIRPGKDLDEPIYVNVSFSIMALNKLNEVEGYISTTGYLYVSWMDFRMAWDSSLYDDIESISIPANKVWTPELVVSNPADTVQLFDQLSTRVRFNSDGYALWMPGSVLKTVCLIRIPAYPFDVHYCYIDIVLWEYDITEVQLHSPDDKVFEEFYSENSEWALTNTSAMFSIKDYYNQISFGLEYSRKPTFLVVNLVIPVVFLNIINSLVFLLPQDSCERVTFSVTILLSFTMFLIVIGHNVPKSMTPMPFLCDYVVIVLITSGLISLSVIVCQRLYHTRGGEPIPRWLLTCFCMRANKLVSEDDKMTPHGLKSYLASLEKLTVKQVILKLDKFLFLFFFVVDIALAVGFIITMSSVHR